jgi:hypothetical protein
MTKKFDNLNDAFNIDAEIVSEPIEAIEQKIEKIATVKKTMTIQEVIYIQS